MMDWTDRHCRVFHRVLSRETLLYTEMVTAPALVRGGALHLLDHAPVEHPLALQLGGSDPAELAQAARLGAESGYDEINLNCGCPSDRVQSGTFGAVLMKAPETVARAVSAMRDVVDVPVTVKCRIGVDDQDAETVLPDFLAQIRDAGCTRVTVHARKAWLQGLSPKENRDIPPLDYDLVHRMKAAFPDMHVSINGGIETLDAAKGFLEAGLDGVMIGRAAYHRPWDILADADRAIYGKDRAPIAPEDAACAMQPYIADHIAGGGKLHQITRHMLGLFTGRPGARIWRRVLSENATRPEADGRLIDRALEEMQVARDAA
ncbi:tRNA-dihydrouridine synthase C [Roseivivax sp. THAF40]|uniref:tRNA dihydrouridine(20/20a) synthase DusA n=1 Tax=unclassified Roseivivax TaxID=2639302 RepID=UPI0012A95635|nr:MULTISPECIES: tRNA dihydrouridine(20/20a) synthase DusA [unclassified Roseivivax]QFS82957.1 tRNA-dihydrouridine synthase C [Roseivivax sp. THAF197b]QFT46728.1 tRNA-dihydrouridine synthase C [Roseivivax sp. THAF40]